MHFAKCMIQLKIGKNENCFLELTKHWRDNMKQDSYINYNENSTPAPLNHNNKFRIPFIQELFARIIAFAKNQPVLMIATVAMLITCFFVPFDETYFSYFNFQTLATLYCTLAVVSAFAHIHVFEIISKNIVLKLHNLRNATFGLVFITYFGSMLLANDMALLTFLPLGFFVLNSTNNKKHMAFTFIMQNIAANLGGMITPFGNPQNLYLYSYYNIQTSEFFEIMLIPFITATLLIILCCMFVKPEPLTLVGQEEYKLDKSKTIIYSILFVASILIVFRIVPYVMGTVVISLILFVMDRDSLKEVNYPLLLTFCVFFIFSGNMARIPQVKSLFETVLPKSPLLIGSLSCQIISNVPSSILLSKFTTDYQNLLVAVNIGGLGTLIASLASLITFTEYKKNEPTKVKKYLVLFSALNFGFLAVLIIVQSIIS